MSLKWKSKGEVKNREEALVRDFFPDEQAGGEDEPDNQPDSDAKQAWQDGK